MVDLSVIVMAKNNADTIEGVVRNGLQLGDEVIVVDTGSTDKTRQLAERTGAFVLNYGPRNFDYSTPRNMGNDAASGAWVFHLDTDEYVDPQTAPRLRRCMEDTRFQNYIIGQVQVRNGRHDRWISCFQQRFFLRHDYCYVGLVFESLSPDTPYGVASIVLLHQRKPKDDTHRRELFRRELAEYQSDPSFSDPASFAVRIGRIKNLFAPLLGDFGDRNHLSEYFRLISSLDMTSQILCSNPLDVTLRLSLAEAYIVGRGYGHALRVLEPLRGHVDLPPTYWAHLAWCWSSLGDHDKAVSTNDQVLRLYPDGWVGYENRLAILTAAGRCDTQEFRDTEDHLRQLFPEHPGLPVRASQSASSSLSR